MDYEDLIPALGGVNSVARLLEIKPPSVCGWKRTGVPSEKLIRLAVIAEGRGIAKRWDLRPNDWWKIWPELIGREGAPKVEAEHE